MKIKYFIAGLMTLSLFMSLSCGSTKGTINAKNNHVEKNVTIKPEEYYEYEIVLEDKMTAVGLSGEWRVNDGGDRKAKVFVMDEENFLKFKNNEAFKSYYDSGEKITHNFQIRLTSLYKSKKTLYYLILDNPSKEDEKKIEFKLDMDFEMGAGTRD
jgi:hypothetical protein